MNKLKGYVIYSKDQPHELVNFLKYSDGCEYTQVPAIEPELVSLIGTDTLFNVPKAESYLNRKPTLQEIATALSHINCWRAIISDENIADNEFVIIAHAGISLVKNYYSALQKHISSFLSWSKYQLVLLERSDSDVFLGHPNFRDGAEYHFYRVQSALCI